MPDLLVDGHRLYILGNGGSNRGTSEGSRQCSCIDVIIIRKSSLLQHKCNNDEELHIYSKQIQFAAIHITLTKSSELVRRFRIKRLPSFTLF